MASEDDYLEDGDRLLSFTVDIVSAHVAHNSVAMVDVPAFIMNVHGALASLSNPYETEPEDARHGFPRVGSFYDLLCGYDLGLSEGKLPWCDNYSCWRCWR